MHEYDHHIGDYTRDTVGLAMVEDGCYRRLLDQYYATELPLPLDKAELYRMARAAGPAERKVVDYILTRYFFKRDDGYHNTRADKEIGKLHEKSAKAKAAADERWERERERRAGERRRTDANAYADADANAHPNAYANAMQTDMRTPCESDANGMPPASARAHTGAGAVFRLPSSALPSSELQNREVGGSSPPVPATGPPPLPHVNGAVEKSVRQRRKSAPGMRWNDMVWVAHTAETVEEPRRQNEAEEDWKDRVFMAIERRMKTAGADWSRRQSTKEPRP